MRYDHPVSDSRPPAAAPIRIPLFDPEPELSELDDELDAAWRRVKASGRFILGPEVESFEQELAATLGIEHAVGVGSGTDALVIALRALGIGPGDEVLTSALSFVATPEAICTVGATPVFVDIDPASYCLDAGLLARALGSRTKAILPVHLFGHAADMTAILAFAHDHGLLVLEDVAQAFGGSFEGRRLGSLGHASALSFFPSKNLGGLGDGGLVGTSNSALADKARALRAHGTRHGHPSEVIGCNSRLDALQAAFLRAKLPHVAGWNEARRVAAARYGELLRDVSGVVLPCELPGVRHVYHQVTIRVARGRRDALRERLAAQGIQTAIYYPRALHELPAYARTSARPRCPEAEAACRELLSLPLWPRIGADVQERVARAIRTALGERGP
jgi:dTDP-4-amino-4,6-dideoxygalactose transaminase